MGHSEISVAVFANNVEAIIRPFIESILADFGECLDARRNSTPQPGFNPRYYWGELDRLQP